MFLFLLKVKNRQADWHLSHEPDLNVFVIDSLHDFVLQAYSAALLTYLKNAFLLDHYVAPKHLNG